MRNFKHMTRVKLALADARCLRECALVEFHGEELAGIPLVTFSGTMHSLEAACAALEGREIEFAAVSAETGQVYLVNTEGYAYARYVDRLARRDAEELLRMQAEAGVAK